MANVVVLVKVSMSAAARTPVYLAMTGRSAAQPAAAAGDVTASPLKLEARLLDGVRAFATDPRLIASQVKGRHRILVIREAGDADLDLLGAVGASRRVSLKRRTPAVSLR
jgi:hypothetical protein